MNYFAILYSELSLRNQTSGDNALIKMFDGHYSKICPHFNECVNHVVKECDEDFTTQYLISEIEYTFSSAFKNMTVCGGDIDLTLWELLNFDNTNFQYALNKTSLQILNSLSFAMM